MILDDFNNPHATLLKGTHGQQIVDAIRALENRTRVLGQDFSRTQREFILGAVSFSDSSGATSQFDDERYWVQAKVVLKGAGDAGTDEFVFAADVANFPDTPGGNVVCVQNMAEWFSGTHSIPIGTPVVAMGWFDASGVKRYVMWHTQPKVKVITTGATNPYPVAILSGIPNPNPAVGSSQVGTMTNLPELSGVGQPIPVGTQLDAFIVKALPSGILLDCTFPYTPFRIGVDLCDSSTDVLGDIATGFYPFIDDFSTYSIDAPYGDIPGGWAIQWKGMDFSGVNTGTGIGNPAPTITNVGDAVQVRLSGAQSATPATWTQYKIKWGLAPGTASRISPSICGALRITADLSAYVDIQPQKYITIEDCAGSTIGTAGGTDTLKLANGLVGTAAANVVTIAPNYKAGSGITFTPITSCGGITIAATGSSGTFNIEDCGGTVQGGVGTTQYMGGFAVGTVAAGVAQVSLSLDALALALSGTCGNLTTVGASDYDDIPDGTGSLAISGSSITLTMHTYRRPHYNGLSGPKGANGSGADLVFTGNC